MRYEQSRWKIGTAANPSREEGATGSRSSGRSGRVSNEVTGAASACHSLDERVGTGAGVEGARLSAGLAQQAGVAHRVESHPVQQQLDFAALGFEPVPAYTVTTPCHTRRSPSKSTIGIFTACDLMS